MYQLDTSFYTIYRLNTLLYDESRRTRCIGILLSEMYQSNTYVMYRSDTSCDCIRTYAMY